MFYILICTLIAVAVAAAATFVVLSSLNRVLGTLQGQLDKIKSNGEIQAEQATAISNSLQAHNKRIDAVCSRLDAIEDTLSNLPAPRAYAQDNYRTATTVPNVPDTKGKQLPKDSPNASAASANTQFFARAYDEGDHHIVAPVSSDNASSTAPFVVSAKGNSGELRFNSSSFAHNIGNAEVLILPFCDVELQAKGTPVRIDNVSAGEVRQQNGEWTITKKPKIKVV